MPGYRPLVIWLRKSWLVLVLPREVLVGLGLAQLVDEQLDGLDPVHLAKDRGQRFVAPFKMGPVRTGCDFMRTTSSAVTPTRLATSRVVIVPLPCR